MNKENQQSLDILIQKISIDNEKINQLQFKHNNNNYIAKITPKHINLELDDSYNGYFPSSMHVKMNKSDLKTYWNFNHCCGAQGFGQDANDVCPACKSKGSLVEFDKNDKTTFMMYAGYTDALYNILTHLPTYCLVLENEITSIAKSLYKQSNGNTSSKLSKYPDEVWRAIL